MKTRLLTAIACAASFLCAADDDFTLKSSLSGTDFDWSQGSSYEGGAAPSAAGAYVRIPSGMVAKLSAADTTSWNFVNAKIVRIRPMTSNSWLEVTVASGTATLSSGIFHEASTSSTYHNHGGLIKKGGGELTLAADDPYSYVTSLDVQEGTLTLYGSGSADTKYYFDAISVAKDAVLNTVGGAGVTVCTTFSGEGEIHGPGGGALQTFSGTKNVSVFSGKFTGFTGDFLNVYSPIHLSGTNSTASGTVTLLSAASSDPDDVSGVYVPTLNKSSATEGILGPRTTFNIGGSSRPGGIHYTGTGETSNISLSYRGTDNGSYIFIDAGPHGGLTLSGGKIEAGQQSSILNTELLLEGSNVVESVFAMNLSERDRNASNGGDHGAFHVVKRGIGTWRMADVSNTKLSGGISVENGLLRYDSLAEAGVRCSLGYATSLYERYSGRTNDAMRADWAMSLGTTNGTEGAMEYSGSAGVSCSTRPIALKGDGRLVQNRATPFRFKGVASKGANGKTLTLDGSSEGENVLAGLDDSGGGAISITKEGTGTWMLAADSSFRGSLAVKAGTLSVCATNAEHRWFRFTDMQVFTNTPAVNNTNYDGTPSKTFSIREMAFFNADGVCQSVGIQFTNVWQSVTPGFFSYAKDPVVAGAGWIKMFDDTTEAVSGTMPAAPMWNDESTWIPLVIRIPSSAAAVTSFDIVWQSSMTGKNSLNYPMDFKIEGSADGISWETLFITNGVISPGSGKWLGTMGSYNNGDLAASATDPAKRHQGISLVRTQFQAVGPLDSASSVFVATNGTLQSFGGAVELRSFGIDMETGGGTVDGFAFAERGTLSMVNAPKEGATASFTPVNCMGVANLSNWTLLVNGRETAKFRASAQDDGTVKLTPIGFRFLVR